MLVNGSLDLSDDAAASGGSLHERCNERGQNCGEDYSDGNVDPFAVQSVLPAAAVRGSVPGQGVDRLFQGSTLDERISEGHYLC